MAPVEAHHQKVTASHCSALREKKLLRNVQIFSIVRTEDCVADSNPSQHSLILDGTCPCYTVTIYTPKGVRTSKHLTIAQYKVSKRDAGNHLNVTAGAEH